MFKYIIMASLLFVLGTICINAFADGTGVFVSGDGYVLTNRHVIEDSLANPNVSYLVYLKGQFYQARVVGTGVGVDLALLKIEADTPCLKVATQTLSHGDTLTADVFDLESGSYDQLNTKRSLKTIHVNNTMDLFEQFGFTFESIVRPGNSGSPVLNANGDIVSVIFAADFYEIGTHRVYTKGIALDNRLVSEFQKEHSDQMVCFFPDTKDLKNDITWIVQMG